MQYHKRPCIIMQLRESTLWPIAGKSKWRIKAKKLWSNQKILTQLYGCAVRFLESKRCTANKGRYYGNFLMGKMCFSVLILAMANHLFTKPSQSFRIF